jgi:SAM-dependent methyltransferase
VTPTYRLGRSDAETRRLMLQDQIYGPLTRRLFVAAGITAGMRVLDLGSGAGDVALLLSELVGPTGSVVGVDSDPAVLAVARARAEAAGRTNASFWCVDVERLSAADGPAGAFDAVAGRWILMHLADPVGALRHAVARLRPGGVVVVQESDYGSLRLTEPPAPLHGWLAERLPSPPGPPGFPPGVGFGLHRLFLEAGLPAPHLRLEAPVGGGADWPGYRYLAETVRSILPYLEGTGSVTAAELDVDTLEHRLRDDVVTRNAVQLLPPTVGAWTRR